MSFPKLEIKIDGARAHIYSGGNEIHGVKKYILEHSANDVAVLHLDLIATDCAVSGDFIPALPDIYKDFYVRREDFPEENPE